MAGLRYRISYYQFIFTINDEIDVPLKNILQYDINHFKFNIIYRIRIYSYRSVNFYDQGTTLT